LKKLLDIGCGDHKFKSAEYEVTGADLYNTEDADLVFDLTKKWPVKSGSYDVVRANHVMEHFLDIVPIMDEAYRALKPGGEFWINVPHFSSPAAWSNPTHCRCFSLYAFGLFDRDCKEHYGKCDFKMQSAKLRFLSDDETGLYKALFGSTGIARLVDAFANRFPVFTEKFLCKLLPFWEARVVLKKK